MWTASALLPEPSLAQLLSCAFPWFRSCTTSLPSSLLCILPTSVLLLPMLFFILRGRVLINSPSWPRIPYVVQSGLELLSAGITGMSYYAQQLSAVFLSFVCLCCPSTFSVTPFLDLMKKTELRFWLSILTRIKNAHECFLSPYLSLLCSNKIHLWLLLRFYGAHCSCR